VAGDPTPLIVATLAVGAILVLALVVLTVRAELDRRTGERRLAALELTTDFLQKRDINALPLSGQLASRLGSLEAAVRDLERAGVRDHDRVTELGVTLAEAQNRLAAVGASAAEQGQSVAALYDSIGRAVGHVRGLAVHSGPEHTPDLYLASRQQESGALKETWRCHHCGYRERRDAARTERTDLAWPAPDAVLEPDPPPTPATRPAPPPRNVVAAGDGLVEAMRRRP